MEFRRIKSIKSKTYDALSHKNEERFTTAEIKAKVVKSKISDSQQREAIFHITFGEGIDNARDLIAIGTAHGIVRKSGSWMQYECTDGTEIRSQGTPAFKNDILTRPGAYDDLAMRVLQAIRAGSTDVTRPVSDAEDDVDEGLGFISGSDDDE